MNWPQQLVFVRHAESMVNILSIEEMVRLKVVDHEASLTLRGLVQLNYTAEYLYQTYGSFDSYFISTYQRTKETLQQLYPGVKPIKSSLLNEAHWGIWLRMTEEQIRERFPEEIEWRDSEGLYHHRALGGGQNWPDMECLAITFLQMLQLQYVGKRVLIVGHRNWFIAMQRVIHHFPIEEIFKKREDEEFCRNASVTEYQPEEVEGQLRLVLKKECLVPWK